MEEAVKQAKAREHGTTRTNFADAFFSSCLSLVLDLAGMCQAKHEDLEAQLQRSRDVLQHLQKLEAGPRGWCAHRERCQMRSSGTGRDADLSQSGSDSILGGRGEGAGAMRAQSLLPFVRPAWLASWPRSAAHAKRQHRAPSSGQRALLFERV